MRKDLSASGSRRILTPMQIEDVKPNKPNFGLVVLLFAATILVVAVAAVIVVTWRAHSAKKAPFTKHPLAWSAPSAAKPARLA